MVFLAVVTGLSGVGKSSLLSQISRNFGSQLLSASRLIADELNRRGQPDVNHDTLRTRDIEENQKALISAFFQKVNRSVDLVLLDAHVVIDTPQGLYYVPAEVFSSFKPNIFIFLEDEPERIFMHRASDRIRQRPSRNADTLRDQQTIAKVATKRVAEDLNVPFYVIQASDAGALNGVLQAQGVCRR